MMRNLWALRALGHTRLGLETSGSRRFGNGGLLLRPTKRQRHVSYGWSEDIHGLQRQSSTSSTMSAAMFPGNVAVEDVIFDLFRFTDRESVSIPRFLRALGEYGLRKDDPRLKDMIQSLVDLETNTELDADLSDTISDQRHVELGRDAFKRCIAKSSVIITKALKNQLVIPDWGGFCNQIEEMFEQCRDFKGGNVATYIPQLARVDPEFWAVSICTVDGQRRSWGDSMTPFCMQSVSKPFTYAIAVEELGADEVHHYVGQEPSGRLFNDICLDYNSRPHNPLINAGAIVIASLIRQKQCFSDRFDFTMQQYKRFAAQGFVGFNNAVFLSERETADRNYALSYYMREHKCFPPNAKLQETLDFYFQLCSIETNADTLAVMGATLANGGVCPLNGDRVVCNRACRDVLSLMYSCGMYDYSGQFAFRVGLPAKSGVSGDMIIVVPNVMAICIYSPRLDTLGNTVRGVKFAEALVECFNFHNYDSLVYSEVCKIDPRRKLHEVEHEQIVHLLFAAKSGDITAVKRHILLGADVDQPDYDGRTALHVAASEGHAKIVRFLLKRWKASPDPKDRAPLREDNVTLLSGSLDWLTGAIIEMDHANMPMDHNSSNNSSMPPMSMSMMSMWFHFSHSDVILFDFWHPKSVIALLGSCVLIFCIAVAYEGLKWFRLHLQSRLFVVNRERPPTYAATTPIAYTKPFRLNTFSLPHLIQTLLFVVQIILSYGLMLVFMTYNVWLALSVILGAGVGYFIFGAQMTVLTERQMGGDCCE
uniref:glutaminase n=1 Tax=Plectus sambesii TaxID=2011161 RepID=A0A914WTX4_9BILA